MNQIIKKRADGSVSVQTSFEGEESLTQQQFKDQCDANIIIAKYTNGQEITHLAREQGVYADVSDITDYHSSLQRVIAAREAFDTLPSTVRLRFNNDPAHLLNFLQDPNNYDEGVKLGIYQPRPSTQTQTQNSNEPNDQKTQTQTPSNGSDPKK